MPSKHGPTSAAIIRHGFRFTDGAGFGTSIPTLHDFRMLLADHSSCKRWRSCRCPMHPIGPEGISHHPGNRLPRFELPRPLLVPFLQPQSLAIPVSVKALPLPFRLTANSCPVFRSKR